MSLRLLIALALLVAGVGVFASLAGVAACTPAREVWDPCILAVDADPDAPNDPTRGTLADGAIASGLNPSDRSTCPPLQTVRCINFNAVAQDNQCHPTSLVCAVPCHADSDCADQGQNVVCSSACNSVLDDAGNPAGVCSPMQ